MSAGVGKCLPQRPNLTDKGENLGKPGEPARFTFQGTGWTQAVKYNISSGRLARV